MRDCERAAEGISDLSDDEKNWSNTSLTIEKTK